jgi:hypothetical protein
MKNREGTENCIIVPFEKTSTVGPNWGLCGGSTHLNVNMCYTGGKFMRTQWTRVRRMCGVSGTEQPRKFHLG